MRYEVLLLEPALAFLATVPVKLRAKAYRTMELLAAFGLALTEPHSKAIRGGEGLRELRIRQGSDICRLFYFHHRGVVYVVASGFLKKTPKTDRRELARALTIMRTYREEHNHGS